MRLPVILTALGCDVNEFLAEGYKKAQIVPSLMSASHIVTVSRDLTEKLIEMDVPVSRITTIPNGVNGNLFFQNHEITPDSVETRKRHILFVGRLSEEKDVSILLEAICRLKDVRHDFRVDIVGDGPEREALEEYTRSNSLDHLIAFHGEVNHSQVSDYLRESDVFCLPSKREGCPNVVLEALASGIPVVAFRVGGIPDMVNEKTGILVGSRTPHDLTTALDSALSSTWDKSEIANSVREHTWERAAARYIEIIQQLMSQTDES